MRRLGTFLFGGTLVVVAIGCNSLLENEPGRLDRGASAGQSPGPSATPEDGSAAEPISGSSNGTGSSGGEVGATPDAGGTACGTSQKVCGGLCVSVEDPFFGCGALACARCDVPNATAACLAGACGVGTCAPGFADCNALPADGCEASLQTVTDCGGCGLACPTLENVAMTCVGGACTGTCAAGFGDCNGKVEDGCEKNLLKDRNNCGTCGARCVFGKCEQGACVWGNDD